MAKKVMKQQLFMKILFAKCNIAIKISTIKGPLQTFLLHLLSMKAAIYISVILLVILPAISEACLVNCNGVTPATCTSPCYNCGTCNTRYSSFSNASETHIS